MKGRTAPKGGYAFPGKEGPRQAIWDTFREHGERVRGTAHCLLMPSSEGIEVEVALRAGFKERNLHLVDRNHGIVGHLKRRYPQASCYGREVEVAVESIRARGIRLSYLNLDLCGNLGWPLIRALKGISGCGYLSPGTLVAVTLLKGRELPPMVEEIDEEEKRCGALAARLKLNTREAARIYLVGGLLTYLGHLSYTPEKATVAEAIKAGTYTSSHKMGMLWGIYNIRPLECRRSI